MHSHFKDPVFATVVLIIKYKSLCFLLRMKKQSWKLCMSTVRLYGISQLRTVNNCYMLTSPMATFFWRNSSKVSPKNTTRSNSCLHNRNQDSRLFDFQPKMIKREHIYLSRPSKTQRHPAKRTPRLMSAFVVLVIWRECTQINTLKLG